MGRTLPSAAVYLMQEEANFSKFRRALRRSVQVALDDLFAAAKQHTAAAQYDSHALPFEVFLLSMLLEEHKETRILRDLVDNILMMHGNNQTISEKMPRLNNTRSGFIDPGFGVDDNPEDDLESVAG
ncbi:MAG: hypothetical protein ABSF99_10345 [Anaerolineales bacterium]|jgi:hypothetical protein